MYFLCKHLSSSGIADTKSTDLFAVFISNDEKQASYSISSLSFCNDIDLSLGVSKWLAA